MIISASRRTDIPAWYAEWFMNRIRAGYCLVPNPFNRTQVSRVSLEPREVDVIVFWTRNPLPLMPHLSELDERGYRYYFLYTVMNNPRTLDPSCPPLPEAVESFEALAVRVGGGRVVWRYDPIVPTTVTGPEFHLESFGRIARGLRGLTSRCIVSVVDSYRKTRSRMEGLRRRGVEPVEWDRDTLGRVLGGMARTASDNLIDVFSCAESTDFVPYGIGAGSCVDDRFIGKAFGIEVSHRKDPSQRRACNCVVSKDIGMYDTCPYGCVYCYATSSVSLAARNRREHDPHAPSLGGQAAGEGRLRGPADFA